MSATVRLPGTSRLPISGLLRDTSRLGQRETPRSCHQELSPDRQRIDAVGDEYRDDEAFLVAAIWTYGEACVEASRADGVPAKPAIVV
jgi:hypothetical protein